MKKYRNGDNSKLPQIIVILILSLAGISFGMSFSWTSPAILELISDKSRNITLEEASYFTVLPQVTMMLAAPVYSKLLNVIGRKYTSLLIGVPHLLSWILTGFASNVMIFYLARLLCGIGDAGIFTVLPLYICEISEPTIRGTWGNSFAALIAFGKFLVIPIGGYTSIVTTSVFGGLISLLYIMLTLLIPESPYYLLMKNKDIDAKKTLKQLRWRHDVEEELLQIKADVTRQLLETGTYRDLYRVDSNRHAMIIAIGLRIAQQFSGQAAFETYSQYMFQQAGSAISENISAAIFTFICLPVLCVFIPYGNRFGRRTLSLISSISCALILSVESVYLGIRQFTNVPMSDFTWVPLTGMVLYVMAFCSGLGFLPILTQGELFPASIKTKATGVITIVVSVNNIIVPKLFQTLTINYGIFTPFAFFSFCTTLSAVFCYFYVIETSGKTLEEIQQILKQKCNSNGSN